MCNFPFAIGFNYFVSPLTLSKTTVVWLVVTANLVREMDELRMGMNELRLERQAATAGITTTNCMLETGRTGAGLLR